MALTRHHNGRVCEMPQVQARVNAWRVGVGGPGRDGEVDETAVDRKGGDLS